MTRRLSVEWPDRRPFADRGDLPFRILAVSDELDPALKDVRTRKGLGSIDLIVGCGDLDCDDLAFLADGFNAPMLYIYGNHDGDERWAECESFCPSPMKSGRIRHESGLTFAGLHWPGKRGRRASRSELGAWKQAAFVALERYGHSDPLVLVTHAPPLGVGDVANGQFHRGFEGYRWLLGRVKPRLWLHGHTSLAATADWRLEVNGTTVVNVTEAVVVELLSPDRKAAQPVNGDGHVAPAEGDHAHAVAAAVAVGGEAGDRAGNSLVPRSVAKRPPRNTERETASTGPRSGAAD